MKPATKSALTASAVAVLFLAAGSARAEDFLHARVAFEEGGALVRGLNDDDWSFAPLNTLVLPGDTLWADSGATLEVEMSGGRSCAWPTGARWRLSNCRPMRC